MPYGRPVEQLKATLNVRVASAEADGTADPNNNSAATVEPRAVIFRRRNGLVMNTSRSSQVITAWRVRFMVTLAGRGSAEIPNTAEHRRKPRPRAGGAVAPPGSRATQVRSTARSPP